MGGDCPLFPPENDRSLGDVFLFGVFLDDWDFDGDSLGVGAGGAIAVFGARVVGTDREDGIFSILRFGWGSCSAFWSSLLSRPRFDGIGILRRFDGEGGALSDVADDKAAFDDSDIMAGVVDEGTVGTGVDTMGLFAIGAAVIVLSLVAASEDTISIAGASGEAFITTVLSADSVLGAIAE